MAPFERIHKNQTVMHKYLEEQQLLDHFAGLAMNGFISKYGNEGAYPVLAEMSYQVAKAMLKERKEVNNERH